MLSIQERNLIIKLHKGGQNQERIAGLIGCSQPTVHRWIYNNVQGRTFQTLPRSGRPTKLTEENLAKIKRKTLKRIREANEEFCSISTKEVGKIIKQEIGEAYSIRHIERIMHKLGFSLITPRPQHIRHEQEKADNFRDEFKKNSKQYIWAMK